MTIAELKQSKKCYIHHTASRRGYISRKTEGYIEAYKGRFGEGYILCSPRFDTTQYINITYYIKREEL